MINLNSLISPKLPWRLISAEGINDHGQIAALGVFGEEKRVFLLTPGGSLGATESRGRDCSPRVTTSLAIRNSRVVRSDWKFRIWEDVSAGFDNSSSPAAEITAAGRSLDISGEKGNPIGGREDILTN